jgi:heme-binding NEAT domain protein
MQGYNDGYEACTNNQPSNNPSGPSSHPTPQKPVVGDPIQSLNNDQVVFGFVLVIVIALFNC